MRRQVHPKWQWMVRYSVTTTDAYPLDERIFTDEDEARGMARFVNQRGAKIVTLSRREVLYGPWEEC